MTFSDALIALRQGYHVRRIGWKGENQYIVLAISVSWEEHNGECYQLAHYTAGNQVVIFHDTYGSQIGWVPSQVDLLSDDWEVLK